MPAFNIHPNIAKARTIDTDFYTNPRYYEQSREKIFAPSWQFIGDTDMLKENGSAHPFVLLENYLDEPLLLTKDKEGGLHCLSNVCTHRGNLLVYRSCRLNQLSCKYHGRRFSLDGKFVSMPEFKEVENFTTEAANCRFSAGANCSSPAWAGISPPALFSRRFRSGSIGFRPTRWCSGPTCRKTTM
jgi:choline monooxygenase